MLKAIFLWRREKRKRKEGRRKEVVLRGFWLGGPEDHQGPPQKAGVEKRNRGDGLYLEDLEAIDVQHPNTVLILGLLHGPVDGLRWGTGRQAPPEQVFEHRCPPDVPTRRAPSASTVVGFCPGALPHTPPLLPHL